VQRTHQELAVIEAIYDLSLPLDDWLRGISRAIARDLGASLGTLTTKCTRRPDSSYEALPLYVDTPPEIEPGFDAVVGPVTQANSELLALAMRKPLLGLIEAFPAWHPYRLVCARYLEPIGGVESNALLVFDTAAHLISISPLFTRNATPAASVRVKYSRLAAHLAAAMRLRRRLDANPAYDPEAILDPAGRVCDAQGAARSGDALADLRAAVRARETALARSRTGEPDNAPMLWKGMVSGRWSLLDRFESDGRRFVVALANENIPKDPRALTPREEQVAQLAGLGAPNGQIGYAVGISAECVSAHLHCALRKLKCQSRRDLIRMMRRGNVEFTMDVHGDLIGVIAEPAADFELPGSLTPAEQRVFTALQAGKTNAEIAGQLGTSQRTVANQVASILRKTNVVSRYALMREYG